MVGICDESAILHVRRAQERILGATKNGQYLDPELLRALKHFFPNNKPFCWRWITKIPF